MTNEQVIAFPLIQILNVLVTLAVGVVVLMRAGKTEKREISFTSEFAPKAHTAERLERTEADIIRIDAKRSADVAALHQELTQVRESVASVESSTAAMAREMERTADQLVEINRAIGVTLSPRP